MTKDIVYDKLCKIPAKIRKHAEKTLKNGSKAHALAKRDELLMTWLTILPWRQVHLRQLKIGSREDGANLFRESISDSPMIARPGWVEEALKQNPQQRFWQFYFRDDETRIGRPIHALLPRQLVPLLEEYLTRHRPLLLIGHDPGNLFLNRNGRSLNANSFTKLVGDLARRHIGTRVTPHLFRYSFAVKWLEDNPSGYLVLSMILWHRNIRTTLTTIGPLPDISHGVRQTEEWLEKRGLTKKNKKN